MRTEFLKGAGLWPVPQRPPVEVISHSRREYRDYSVENVVLETFPGFYCTGNLYRPLGRKDLSPAILCPHGHFRPLGRFRDNHQIRCAHLARMGATVVYRGIGLADWYHMLSAGFRVPAVGASDYPACRKLGDCKTYVWSQQQPDLESWLRGMARGESFITTGPLLMLDVDGRRPGSTIHHSGDPPHIVTARVRVRSEVTPVSNVQLIANGRVIREIEVPKSAGQGNWLELEHPIELDRSAWIAARAYSLSSLGTPDAESHTNPIYVLRNGRAPYDSISIDRLVAAIDGQIEAHRSREFAEQAMVVEYFEQAREILIRIRQNEGAVR